MHQPYVPHAMMRVCFQRALQEMQGHSGASQFVSLFIALLQRASSFCAGGFMYGIKNL
jgi:hypothetical protein